jgi:hypothetical protein
MTTPCTNALIEREEECGTERDGAEQREGKSGRDRDAAEQID